MNLLLYPILLPVAAGVLTLLLPRLLRQFVATVASLATFVFTLIIFVKKPVAGFGEYLLLDKNCCPVNRLIYPAPTGKSKGIGILPTIDGNLLLGPTAEDIEDKEDCSTSTAGARKILADTMAICSSLDPSRIIAAFAGVRAVADTNDFIIGPTSVLGFFNAAGIQSPGLTSAPSIAREVSTMVAQHCNAELNPDFQAENKPRIRFADLPVEEKNELNIKSSFRHIRAELDMVRR